MNKTVILESVTILKVPNIRDMIEEIRVELTTTIDILPKVSTMIFFEDPFLIILISKEVQVLFFSASVDEIPIQYQ